MQHKNHHKDDQNVNEFFFCILSLIYCIHICTECPAGYHWINCSRPCVFPHFGERCAYKCSCEMTLCDFMIGCTVGKENARRIDEVNNGFTDQMIVYRPGMKVDILSSGL